MKPLRKKMLDELEQRNFSPRTIEAYVGAVVALTRHYRVSPDSLKPAQVRAWLELQRQSVSGLPFDILVRGLVFFFAEVVGWPRVGAATAAGAAPPQEQTLRQRMTDDLKLRNFSPRTINAYVGAVARFSRHYGKCPTLLGAADIGMALTESLAMTPAASVSGFMLSHPDSTYFNVGKIGDDQLHDLARRRGEKTEDLARLLAPNL